jgi:hypothetical protein
VLRLAPLILTAPFSTLMMQHPTKHTVVCFSSEMVSSVSVFERTLLPSWRQEQRVKFCTTTLLGSSGSESEMSDSRDSAGTERDSAGTEGDSAGTEGDSLAPSSFGRVAAAFNRAAATALIGFPQVMAEPDRLRQNGREDDGALLTDIWPLRCISLLALPFPGHLRCLF